MKKRALEEMANEAADILVPEFSKKYEIKICKPKIIMPRWRSKKADGYFFGEGYAGIVKLNPKACREKNECGRLLSHEIGHSATWQRNKEYFHIAKKHEDYRVYDCLSEGIAMEFEKAGLEALLQKGWIIQDKFRESFEVTREVYTKREGIYGIGYSMVFYLAFKASLKEIIMSPEKFIEDLKDRFSEDLEKLP